MTKENPLLTMIREVCALGRAEVDRPHTPDGVSGAQRALNAELLALDPDGHASDVLLSLPLLTPRAAFFDQAVLDAIAADIPQIVILGTGYDDRALRFRSPGTTYFDLDLDHLITVKARRLAQLGADLTEVHLAGVDFARDDVAEVLDAAGHDAQRPTLFIAEHLALFLDPGDIQRMISGIARRAAARSRFAWTAETHPAELDSAEVVKTVDTVMFGGTGPVRAISSLPRWTTALDEAGWDVEVEELAVDHFTFPLAHRTVQIQTRFITATIRSRDLVRTHSL